MRSISDQFWIMLPALLAAVLLALFAAPMRAGGWALAPNVGWIATLILVVIYPAAWPRWFAFLFGLLQDVLFGTPLGSQALLTLMLVPLAEWQMRRQMGQGFLIQWLEAAGVLVLWHIFLWLLVEFVTPDGPSLRMVLRGGIVSAFWYPVFYFLLTRLALFLPPLK